MIFYKNLKKPRKISKKDLVFSIFEDGMKTNKDDSIAKSNECKTFYNIKVSKGALENGLGFEDLKVPANTENLKDLHTFNFVGRVDEIKTIFCERWYSEEKGKYEYLILMTDSHGTVWFIFLIDKYNGFVWNLSENVSSQPLSCATYRIGTKDCTVMFTEEGMQYFASGVQGVYPNVPAFISSLLYYGRFFGIKNEGKNNLVYTVNTDLRNWDDTATSVIEFLDNRGAFKKLILFNDYVYLFREFGITKISIYTAKNDFAFSHLYISPSYIFEKSISVCGEKIYFATRDGIYSFDGKSAEKLKTDYSEMFCNLDNTNCSGESFNGKYYLATRYDFGDGQNVGCENTTFENNVLIEIDVKTDDVEILRGVDIRNLIRVENPYMNKLCATFNYANKQRIGQLTNDGKLFDIGTQKEWTSFMTDLGECGKRKKIKQIFIDTKYDCEVKILSDESEKILNFEGKNQTQMQFLSIYGQKFQFSFKSYGNDIKICKPMVIFEICE